MTCKDCLYCEVCKDRVAQLGYDFDENGQIPSCGCGVGHGFRNKADFVEVVRCKDCEFFEAHPEDQYGTCGGSHGLYLSKDDFCSLGERKEK